MLPSFAGSDILYIRSMRASKMAVLNVQCRSVVKAGLVKSTFATLVKQTVKPDYIGNVSFVTYILMQYSYVHLSVANWTHFKILFNSGQPQYSYVHLCILNWTHFKHLFNSSKQFLTLCSNLSY